ncbi:MAG: flagellar hook-basal body complex protein [Pseudomonadota bacterium]
MEITGYSLLSRQTGLLRELETIANNVANGSTTGFRAEGLLFSEYVQARDGAPSVSMAHGNVRLTDMTQGGIQRTGGTFDLAIEGEGFFLLETPEGQRLTRAGAFTPNEVGELVNHQGHRLLDLGQAPIFIPVGSNDASIGADGTLSIDGQAQGQIGIWQPVDLTDLRRGDGVKFRTESPLEPVLNPTIMQGFLEGSNVNPIAQITRLIEVQRSYEMGQNFMRNEHDRLTSLVEALSR